TGWPQISAVTDFTWFNVATQQLNTYGFFVMTMSGMIYLIVPKVTGMEWPRPAFVRLHFLLAVIGILLFVVPLAIGGVLQGLKLNNPQVPFMDLTKSTLLFFRASTLGDLAILGGHGLLLANVAALSLGYYRTHFLPVFRATTQVEAAEVKP